MSDTVNYKSEVLEWMADYKAGLVKPQSPLKIHERRGWIAVTLPVNGDDGNHVGCKEDMGEEYEVWHSMHTILRVSEWLYITKKLPKLD